MTIKVGDRVPDVTFLVMKAGEITPVTSADLFGGKKVALFGVPGAFTPTCSASHLPGYMKNSGALKAKGVDAIACVSVNDVFVMNAWGNDQGVGDDVVMLADGSGDFAKATGLVFDLSEKGLGVRNQRYSAVIDDGVVSEFNLDEPGAFEVSSAEKMLEQL
ncbi:MAG: peroxiredoxin [Rhodospirillales bacterium]|jgi:glutaredoxin/glutathione-dependent peroxiredoxin|nr:peroxiredoxin [Rhodospirillales bacterium]